MALDRSEYRRAYYLKNREKALAAAKTWKEANREKANESNKLSARKRRALDPKKFNEASRRWAKKNPEKRKAMEISWRKRNPDYWLAWRAKDVKKWLVDRVRWRALKNGIPFSLIPEDLVIPDVCPALGIKLDVTSRRTADNAISLDRIVPEYGYVPTNVRIISRRANFIKNNATAEELEAIAAYIRRERG